MITAEQIYKDKELRIYFEALLLDHSTPPEVFKTLFGVTPEVVDEYKGKYFRSYSLPRMLLLRDIKNIKDPCEKDIKTKVFYYGWEWIVSILNYGNGVDSSQIGDKIIRSMLGKLSFLSNTDKVSTSDFRMFKELMKMVSDNSKVDTGKHGQDEIEFVISELKKNKSDEESKTMSMIDEINKNMKEALEAQKAQLQKGKEED